jgi:uncharacterized protein
MRLVQGRHGWWYVGRSRAALLPPSYIDGGALTESARAEVDRLGLSAVPTPNHYSLTVLTATSCNLGCGYCFQNTGPAEPGRFNPPRIARSLLGAEVTDRIVAFTRDRMAELGVTRLYVMLFGGEPLLNPVACKEILRRVGELGTMSASMVSNGVLLKPRLAVQLAALGLRSVQITLDGPRDVHDGVRATRSGGATFDTILANVAAAQQATDLSFGFRINVTPVVLDRIDELIAQMAAAVDAGRSGFTIAPVLDYGTGFDGLLARSGRTSARIVEAYRTALDHGFQVATPREMHCDFCFAERGRYGAVVNADGTLYSCWESVGRPGYEVGTIGDGYRDYPRDTWVHCGDLALSDDGQAPLVGIHDEIDAGLLDLMRERQRDGVAA